MNKKFFIVGLLFIFIFAYANLALAVCGDGVIDTGEECDGTNLGNPASTCVSQGYALGTLGCYPSTDTQFGCKFDVSSCVGVSSNFVSVQDGALSATTLVAKAPGSQINILETLDGVADPEDPNDRWLIQSQSGDLYFQWNDASTNNWVYPLTLQKTGNVGIGTTNPQAKLNVVGDINATGTIYSNGQAIGSGGFWNATGTTGDIYYNSGKIGIGTDTPGALIDVFGGNIALRGPSGITPRLIFGESIVDSFTPFEFVSFSRPSSSLDTCSGDIDTQYRCDPIETISCVDLTNSTVATQTAYYNRTVKCVLDTNTYSINNNGGTLAFIDNNGNNNFVVKQGGNVGIGTGDPQAKLNVVGDVNITGNAYINGQSLGAGGGVWLTSTTPGDIYYSSGKVGIGNNKPLEKLDVNGNVKISGSGQATSVQIGFDVPDITSVAESGAGNINSGTVCYKVSAIYSSGESLLSSEKCTNIVDNKKVTITWTRIAHATGYNFYGRGPTYLKINSQLIPNPTSGNTVSIDDISGTPLGTPPSPTIPSGGLATAGGLVVGGDLEVKGNIIGFTPSGGNSGWTADTTKTTTDLNVGIGTATPTYIVHAVSNRATNDAFRLDNLGSGGSFLSLHTQDGDTNGDPVVGWGIDGQSSGESWHLGLDNSDGDILKLYKGSFGTGEERMVWLADYATVLGSDDNLPSITSNTKAIIANAKINADNSALSIISGNVGSSMINFGDIDGETRGVIKYSHIDDKFDFRTNGVSGRMIIDSTGKIGIGTDNPTSLLDVFGGNIVLRGPSGITPNLIFGEQITDTYSSWSFVSTSPPQSTSDTCTGSDVTAPYTCGSTEVSTQPCNDVAPSTDPSGNLGYYEREITCVLDNNAYKINNDQGALKFINNAGSAKLTLSQDGKIGIGTTTPLLKLSIVGDANGAIALDAPGSHIKLTETLDGLVDPLNPEDYWLVMMQQGNFYLEHSDVDATGVTPTVYTQPLIISTTGKTSLKADGSHLNFYETDQLDQNDHWLIQSNTGNFSMGYDNVDAIGNDNWIWPLTLTARGDVLVGSPTDTKFQYLKVDSGTVGPSVSDCDEDIDAGKLYVVRDVGGDPNVDVLRVCTGASGWKSATLA